jgi:hypothetical protein
VGNYSHREMLTLVVGLAERTGLPVPDLCKVFGEWLFPKLATNFDFAVKPYTNAFDFLRSLDGVIHVEVRKLYPDAQLPHVPVTRVDEHELVMEYRSERPFADVAEGLLRGCLAWFGERASLHREALQPDGAHAARRACHQHAAQRAISDGRPNNFAITACLPPAWCHAQHARCGFVKPSRGIEACVEHRRGDRPAPPQLLLHATLSLRERVRFGRDAGHSFE